MNFGGMQGGAYSGGLVFDKSVIDDSTNAAVFFSERDYKASRGNLDGLDEASARVIRTGGKLNPAGSQGLEMLIWIDR